MLKTLAFRSTLATSVAFMFAACGGGGGSSVVGPGPITSPVSVNPTPTASPTPGPTATPTTAPLSLVDYALPTSSSTVGLLGAGPDGAIWFSEQSRFIGRIDLSGQTSEFAIPWAGGAAPVAGPDGNLYVGVGDGTIGVFNPMTHNASLIPPLNGHWRPSFGVVAPNKTLWFTDARYNAIDTVSTTAALAQYPLPTSSANPQGIAAGSNGNIWFSEASSNSIGRITSGGQITEFPLPATSRVAGPADMTLGPDGNIWFVESQDILSLGGGNLGKITPTGMITEYFALGRSSLSGIASGADGNLWFGSTNSAELGRISISGKFDFSIVPGHTVFDPGSVVTASDGSVWFAESNARRIGRVNFH